MALGVDMGLSTQTGVALIFLALTDSLSFGTLLVPVWLLMTPGRVRAHRIFTYLGTVAGVYFGIGAVLVLGGRAFLDSASGVFDSRPVLVAQLIVGAVLLVASFALDTKAARARATERSERSGRLSRWRTRAMSEKSSAGALAGLAVTAVAVEIASMLPYIAATGIIATQTTAWPAAVMLLAGYCLVMVVPALALTAGRFCAHRAVETPLRRLDAWLTAHARNTTLWIIGIAGFFLAASAVQALGLIPE